MLEKNANQLQDQSRWVLVLVRGWSSSEMAEDVNYIHWGALVVCSGEPDSRKLGCQQSQ